MPNLRFISRVGIFLGVWLIVSPWVFGFSSVNLARWNNLFVGVAIFLTSLWVLLASDEGEGTEK